MKHEQKSVVMDGDTAAAYISYAFTEVASIFPITPSSTIAEKVDAWAANGKKILPGDTLEIHVELLSERAEKAIATYKSPPAIWRRKHGAPSPCAEGLFLSRIPWAFHIQKRPAV